MFNGKEKARIAELEAALDAEKDANDDMVVMLRDIRREKAALEAEVNELKNNQPQIIAGLKLQIAHVEGRLEEAHVDAAKYHEIVDRHEWRIDGKSAAHGETWEAYECAHCKNDRNANTRLLVPPGFFDSVKEEVTA